MSIINSLKSKYFEYPHYDFIMNGPPYHAIGDVSFDYNFESVKSIYIKLNFTVMITTDFRLNRRLEKYTKEVTIK